jgi:hypothetical protein
MLDFAMESRQFVTKSDLHVIPYPGILDGVDRTLRGPPVRMSVRFTKSDNVTWVNNDDPPEFWERSDGAMWPLETRLAASEL